MTTKDGIDQIDLNPTFEEQDCYKVCFDKEALDRTILMIKNSPMFEEDVKENVLNQFRESLKETNWKEPSLTDNNYLRSYYNNMFK